MKGGYNSDLIDILDPYNRDDEKNKRLPYLNESAKTP